MFVLNITADISADTLEEAKKAALEYLHQITEVYESELTEAN